MTDDTKEVCERNMAEAIASGDQTRIWQAFSGAFSAMMHCQSRTRETQKSIDRDMLTLRSDMATVKTDVKELKLESKENNAIKNTVENLGKDVVEMKTSHLQFQALLEQSKGALWMGRIALVAGCGLVYDVIMRLIEHFGK